MKDKTLIGIYIISLIICIIVIILLMIHAIITNHIEGLIIIIVFTVFIIIQEYVIFYKDIKKWISKKKDHSVDYQLDYI